MRFSTEKAARFVILYRALLITYGTQGPKIDIEIVGRQLDFGEQTLEQRVWVNPICLATGQRLI
mgnify:CR=1 FL=1